MRSVNIAILVGNVTRDPEVRQTPNGQSIATFGLATNREWVTNGEKKQSAEFHEIVAWGRLAEICEQFVKKGKLLDIEGYVKTRSWEAEDGTKKFKTEVVAQDIIMLDKRGDRRDSDELETISGPVQENKPAEVKEETKEEVEEPKNEESEAKDEETQEETEAPAEEVKEDTDDKPSVDMDLGL